MSASYEFGRLYADALRKKAARARWLKSNDLGEGPVWIHIDDIMADAFADTFDAMQAEIDKLRTDLTRVTDQRDMLATELVAMRAHLDEAGTVADRDCDKGGDMRLRERIKAHVTDDQLRHELVMLTDEIEHEVLPKLENYLDSLKSWDCEAGTVRAELEILRDLLYNEVES